MKHLFIIALLLIANGAVADQKNRKATIDVPDLTNSQGREAQTKCSDINTPLLEIIKQLTNQESAKNETQYEQDNHLTSDQIRDRRLTVIRTTIQNLHLHQGGQ